MESKGPHMWMKKPSETKKNPDCVFRALPCNMCLNGGRSGIFMCEKLQG